MPKLATIKYFSKIAQYAMFPDIPAFENLSFNPFAHEGNDISFAAIGRLYKYQAGIYSHNKPDKSLKILLINLFSYDLRLDLNPLALNICSAGINGGPLLHTIITFAIYALGLYNARTLNFLREAESPP